MKRVKLGEKYRDTLSGFEGTATGIFEYLYGCLRVQLSGDKDGEPKEFVFDEPQLEALGVKVTQPAPAGSRGGPRSAPPRTGH